MNVHEHRCDGSALASIAVVGAGFSGLVAANVLELAGLNVMIVEACARIGGRILAWPNEDGAHHFDLGPAWVLPGINERLADWLCALGLPLLEQQDQGAALVEWASLAVHRHATGFAQQPPSMRLVGGTARLTDALRARLSRTRVRLGTRLLGLSAGPDGRVHLTLETGGQLQDWADEAETATPADALAAAAPLIHFNRVPSASNTSTTTGIAGLTLCVTVQ